MLNSEVRLNGKCSRSSPYSPLDAPALVELDDADNQQGYNSIVEKHGRKEPHPLTGDLSDGLPNPSELTYAFETVHAHFTAQDFVLVVSSLVEGAVFLRGDHTLSQESHTAGMEGDPSLTLFSRVHLRAASTGSTENLSTKFFCTPTQQLSFWVIVWTSMELPSLVPIPLSHTH